MKRDISTETTEINEKNYEYTLVRVQSAVLTDKEREMLEYLAQGGVKLAAQKMGHSPGYIHQRCYKLRIKLRNSLIFIREIEAYKKKWPDLDKFLRVAV